MESIVSSPSILSLVFVTVVLILSSCVRATIPSSSVVNMPGLQNTPGIAAEVPDATATYIPNTRFIKLAMWAPPYLGETFISGLPESVRSYFVGDRALANVRLEAGEQNVVGEMVLALVAPFSTTTDGVSRNDLLLNWQGQSTGPFAGQPLLMDQNTYELISAVWGPAAPSSATVFAGNELLDYAWAHQPAWAIVPFESLEPRWKVLSVDGLSPIHKGFDLAAYALRIPISLAGDPAAVELVRTSFPSLATNYDPGNMRNIQLYV